MRQHAGRQWRERVLHRGLEDHLVRFAVRAQDAQHERPIPARARPGYCFFERLGTV